MSGLSIDSGVVRFDGYSTGGRNSRRRRCRRHSIEHKLKKIGRDGQKLSCGMALRDYIVRLRAASYADVLSRIRFTLRSHHPPRCLCNQAA